MSYKFRGTPGPWYVVAEDGADFTAIATKQQIDGVLDLDFEVLGSSEWLRANSKDLHVMAAAPEMLEALDDLRTSCNALGLQSKLDQELHNAVAALAKATGDKA